MRLSEVKNELIVTSLDRIETELVYMIQQLKRHFIKLHFEIFHVLFIQNSVIYDLDIEIRSKVVDMSTN